MANKKQPKKSKVSDVGVRASVKEITTLNEAAKLAKQSRCQFVLQAGLDRAATYLTTQSK
jgi:uncharacterized protein (DUF1778 family)